MVAFSGVAVAETREVKVDKILFADCENWAMDQMALYDPGDQLPPEEAHDNYRSLVEECDRNT